jgi:hypothetical protein
MARVSTAAIVILADRVGALLLGFRVDLDIPRALFEPLHNLHHVASGVFLRAVNPPQLKVRPVNVIPKDGNRERVNRGRNQNLPVTPVQIRTLNLLTDSVRPVQLRLGNVQRQARRLSQLGFYYRLLQRARHRRTENSTTRTKQTPVSKV